MVALMFCGAIASGCGDDDDSGNKADDGGPAAEDGGEKDAGGGGAPGSGGRSGGTGGMTMTAMGVKCGSTTCMSPTAGLMIPGVGGGAPCCVDDANGTCGTMMQGMCMPPPPVDPSCPTIMIPILGMMGSCCADNGMCGLDGSILGMGCVDYEMVTSSLGILGGVITLPAPQDCGDDGDAGMMSGDLDAGR
jgi:hypothetical protein